MNSEGENFGKEGMAGLVQCCGVVESDEDQAEGLAFYREEFQLFLGSGHKKLGQ